MAKLLYQCQHCRGSIGTIEHIKQLNTSDEIQTKEFTEVWFDCIYCKAEHDPSKTLITIVL